MVKASDIYTTHHAEMKLPDWDSLPQWFRDMAPYDDFFDVVRLPIKDETNENLYQSDEDFRSKITGIRTPMYVKMGALFIKYCNHGKGSFDLTIERINKTSEKKELLFEYEGQKYDDFCFADLMPFSFEQFDPNVTIVGKRLLDGELKTSLKTLRTLITQMALNMDVLLESFEQAKKQFFLLVDPEEKCKKSNGQALRFLGNPRNELVDCLGELSLSPIKRA